MAKHVWVLDEARARVPQDRATRAVRRGRELPESEAGARAVELSLAASAGPASTGLIPAPARPTRSAEPGLGAVPSGVSN